METPAHVAHSPRHQTNRISILRFAPPLLRTFVLVSSAALALATVMLMTGTPSDGPTVQAQAVTPTASPTATPEPIDYDIDDDGLIDVRNPAQFRWIDADRNGDGVPGGSTGSYFGNTAVDAWRAAYPNPMPGMGCQLTDADNNPNTPDVPTCTGYELLYDIDTQEAGAPDFRPIAFHPTSTRTYQATFKGNGYRILNPTVEHATWHRLGVFAGIGINARVEGLGVINPSFTGTLPSGGIVGALGGILIGSYVYAPDPSRGPRANDENGCIAGHLRYWGKLIDSFCVGHTGGSGAGTIGGGLIGEMNRWNPQITATCRNSYFSGNVRSASAGLIYYDIGTTMQGVNIQNCIGDTTTDPDTSTVWDGASPTQNTNHGATYAQMIAATGYTTGPFVNWDQDENGNTQDVWDFGDATTLPVLKGWGHDRTLPRARTAQLGQTPADTVNLCSRTHAVANEIIRHLQNEVRAQGVTATPADVTALQPCSATSGAQTVSVDNIRDLVVTTEENPFRLNPDRTDPPSERLTSLHADDLAYLVNANHFDFSDNSLTTLPNRLFQGIKIRTLDLSSNSITSLPADAFAGLTPIGAGEETGNVLNLNNNRLSVDGLPDRIFDELSHLNGLSLTSNSLTAINTRWFAKLGNLGRTDPMAETCREDIGLHLGSNTITEHYYWQRAFGTVRVNVVQYTGTNAAADLLAAIRAQMLEARTDITNLNLEFSCHTIEEETGEETGTGTCPPGVTSGPPGSLDADGNPVECEIQTGFNAPWQEGLAGTVQSVTATSNIDSITISFAHATGQEIAAYQFHFRILTTDPDARWTQPWRNAPVNLAQSGTKTFTVSNLDRATAYQFQIRSFANGRGGQPYEFVQATNAILAEVNKITPAIREISVIAGQQIRLEVDVYDVQDYVANELADNDQAKVIFQWTVSPAGGGQFESPVSQRRVTYTTPDLPGTYTILAEAQPRGICASHHPTRFELTDNERAPCIATFTVRVTRAPGTADPTPDPINPAGLIPTSLTDSAGTSYAVFTPVDGGTFTGDGITVSAPEGAIPDQQLLGISATASNIPVPPPIPGARMTVAGGYYTINGVQRSGDAPVSGYTLDDPLLACMPLPDIFRSDISNVVVVNRNQTDGSLAILTSSIRQSPTGLVACGAVGQLPATVAVANVGVIATPPDQPTTTDEELPETGGKAPSTSSAAWAMALATILLALTATGAGITSRRRRSSNRRFL